jgi:Nif-specific regulatory protein
VVGRSPALAALLKQIRLVAPLDVTVLLTGPSGTGKSLLARVIHDSGPRARGPFVDVNCAAIPDDLIENELFGHEKGGFTGAIASKPGRFDLAQHGTLFLDEVGDLSPSAQSKLLRVLQQGQFERVGGTRTLQADVRVIAATNKDLESEIESRRFREDLFYRLNVLPVSVPSLDERREDLPFLARAFISSACERHGFSALTLSRGGERALLAAQWPGNIRQLENTVEAATIRADGDGTTQVESEHLFPASASAAEIAEADGFHEATRRFQADLLRRALEENGGNKSAAARQLKLTRAHVYNLMHSFGLDRET